MNLNEIEWDEFKISDIFPKIEYGKNSYAIDLEDGHDCIYVGAKKDDNGFMKWCKRDESLISKGNCVVFIVDGKGSVGYCNYMDRDFIATANLKLGYCKELNQYTGLFIATIASKERFRYSFGRKWKKFVKDTIIKLPALVDNTGKVKPDWQFMENYIKSLHYKPLRTKNKLDNIPKLDVNNWREFCIKDYFDLTRGHTLSVDLQEEYSGTIPCVNGTLDNNGVQYYLSKEIECVGFKLIKPPAISIVRVGEGGRTFVQNQDFFVADNAFALIPQKNISKYVLFFISTVLNKESIKYSYGRTVTNDYKNTIIKLPAITKEDGSYEPNWGYMENYIKSLPYGDRI